MGSLLLSVNSYLIKGASRSLLVDTTVDYPSCRDLFLSHLKELSVDIASTDIFITHFHIDHSGMVSELAAGKSKIFSSQKEAFSGNKRPWDQMMEDTLIYGYPDSELRKLKERITRPIWHVDNTIKYSILNEGDELAIGEYIFKCLETPGHSAGHMCLYEPNKKILIAGDHILPTISPVISVWANEVDALGVYFNSLNKTAQLNMETVWPGHGDIFTGCNERIAQITGQLESRLVETLNLLKQRAQTAYELASQVTWNITVRWEVLDSFNKLLALGEVLAILKHLEGKKLVRSFNDNGKIKYCSE
jgi:glyoxylase-like metal-dependent hydrolase (beta-lactamase superfamily II)